MGKKFVFYLKGVQRAIAITDQSDSVPLSQCSKTISEAMASDSIFTVSNDRDVLILKPTEISAIHVTEIAKSSISEELYNIQDDELIESSGHSKDKSGSTSGVRDIIELDEILEDFSRGPLFSQHSFTKESDDSKNDSSDWEASETENWSDDAEVDEELNNSSSNVYNYEEKDDEDTSLDEDVDQDREEKIIEKEIQGDFNPFDETPTPRTNKSEEKKGKISKKVDKNSLLADKIVESAKDRLVKVQLQQVDPVSGQVLKIDPNKDKRESSR